MLQKNKKYYNTVFMAILSHLLISQSFSTPPDKGHLYAQAKSKGKDKDTDKANDRNKVVYGALTSGDTFVAPVNKFWVLGQEVNINNQSRFIVLINRQKDFLLIRINKPVQTDQALREFKDLNDPSLVRLNTSRCPTYCCVPTANYGKLTGFQSRDKFCELDDVVKRAIDTFTQQVRAPMDRPPTSWVYCNWVEDYKDLEGNLKQFEPLRAKEKKIISVVSFIDTPTLDNIEERKKYKQFLSDNTFFDPVKRKLLYSDGLIAVCRSKQDGKVSMQAEETSPNSIQPLSIYKNFGIDASNKIWLDIGISKDLSKVLNIQDLSPNSIISMENRADDFLYSFEDLCQIYSKQPNLTHIIVNNDQDEMVDSNTCLEVIEKSLLMKRKGFHFIDLTYIPNMQKKLNKIAEILLNYSDKNDENKEQVVKLVDKISSHLCNENRLVHSAKFIYKLTDFVMLIQGCSEKIVLEDEIREKFRKKCICILNICNYIEQNQPNNFDLTILFSDQTYTKGKGDPIDRSSSVLYQLNDAPSPWYELINKVDSTKLQPQPQYLGAKKPAPRKR